MNIGVNCGHTKVGPGYGAVGIIKESEHTRLVGYAFMDKLKSAGVGVLDCTVHMASTQGEYLEKAVNIANKEDLDWFVSIHFNATTTHTGQGVEVYTYEGEPYKEALKVCSSLEQLGFKNRGVKSGTGLYVIRKTKAKAMLIEICFCDNAMDVALYERIGADGIAQAIFNAFLDCSIPSSSINEEQHNMSRQDFIEYVGAIARRDWADTRRVLPSVVVAQAIKESGAGTSELARKANALFGIKENGWKKKTYVKNATEQRPDGSYYQIPHTVWRAYNNWEESILDHNDYIATRKINDKELLYGKVIGEMDYKKACFSLQEAGYATSLTYGKSLIDCIEKENLSRFDIPLKEGGEEKKLYRVQVGAFSIQENAIRFANTMNQKGIKTEILYL